jgi:hypothetical protein
MTKVYLACGVPHQGTSGWINYSQATAEKSAEVRAEVFKDFPNSVIIDGNDDWYAKEHLRPHYFAQTMELPILAYYHSGISGLVRSGIVVSADVFRNFEVDYEERYGVPVNQYLRIYKNVE